MGLMIGDIKERSVDGIIEALREIAVFDLDFNGENGDEYLWEESEQMGFASNLDYVCDLVQKELHKEKNKEINYKTAMRATELFTNKWPRNDSYYLYHNYDIVTRGDECPIAIVFCFVSESDLF